MRLWSIVIQCPVALSLVRPLMRVIRVIKIPRGESNSEAANTRREAYRDSPHGMFSQMCPGLLPSALVQDGPDTWSGVKPPGVDSGNVTTVSGS